MSIGSRVTSESKPKLGPFGLPRRNVHTYSHRWHSSRARATPSEWLRNPKATQPRNAELGNLRDGIGAIDMRFCRTYSAFGASSIGTTRLS